MPENEKNRKQIKEFYKFDRELLSKNNPIEKDQVKESGITLIALVITIIVLLILAGVSIMALTGENGILENAKESHSKTTIEEEKEKVQLSVTAALADGLGKEIKQSDLEKELGSYYNSDLYKVVEGINQDGEEGYIVTITEQVKEGRNYFVKKNGEIEMYEGEDIEEPAKPEDGIGTEFNMAYGVIEVEFLSGTSYRTTNTPNHPLLQEGLTAITYDTNGTPQEVENVDSTNWYHYEAQTTDTVNGGTSKWANAQTSDGSFYVWIPRYAYRIIYFNSQDSENKYRNGELTEEDAIEQGSLLGYSDARGIVDVQGRTRKGVAVETAIPVNNKYFKTHPVFEDNFDYGGWSSKLKGIWIAKYEASQGANNKPQSKPNIKCWRGIQIGNMYNYAKAYIPELKSHMLKNSEWGAVSYLTESKYGRNGTEVTINNNNQYITGQAGNSISAAASASTYSYNTAKGMLASSTGNIYGIYDLSGGIYEYVAGYYKAGNLTYGASFANGISDAYSTVYNGTTLETSYKYGDAIFETSGWNDDYKTYITASGPFLGCSGVFSDKILAGTYYYYGSSGLHTNGGFRIALTIEG